MITTQIITKNNEKTIRDCIESVPWQESLIIADCGSTDKTLEICRKHTKNILNVSGNISNIRNQIALESQTEWQFFIEPWETIENMVPVNDNFDSFKCYVILDDKVILKENRFWKKNVKFTGEVYEVLDTKNSSTLDVFIRSNNATKKDIKLLKDWKKKEPKSSHVDYYLALNYLQERDYDRFLSYASQYLFSGKNSDSFLMINYYLASVYGLIKNDYAQAMKHLVFCLHENPTMAEYWCLLGDIFLRMKQYARAYVFYENAILFGSRRKREDDLPIEIEKYKDYPERMMKICKY